VAAAYLLALLLQSASCGRKKLLSNNTVAVVVRRQHSTSLFSPSKFKDFSAALVIGQDAREKKTKTNRPTLGRTTGEFFDVLEISETQKQLTAPRQRFLRCTDGDQIFKGKPKIRRPAYFQRHNNAITSCAKSKCLRFALFAHQMFDQKKKSAKNKSVTCGGRVPEVVVTSLGPLRHAKEKNSRQLRCVFITTVLFCDYLCLHSKRTINNALNPSIKKN
jgi:hypothetical protein